MDKIDGASERRKLETVQETLHQFMEERRQNNANENGNGEREKDEDVLLSRLLSKLDSAKSSPDSTLKITLKEQEMCLERNSADHKKEEVTDLKEIEKCVKIIKRQNRITHYLLSALIVVTMAWQLGEVSLVFAVREKLTHPLKSIGDMIKGALTRNRKKSLIEGGSLPPIEAPEMPNGSSLIALND